MPISNQWGNSAVDATRKNALPPYLDEVFENGLGSGVRVQDITLPSGNWTSTTYNFGVDEQGKYIVPETATVIQLPIRNEESVYKSVEISGITSTGGVTFTASSVSVTSPKVRLAIIT